MSPDIGELMHDGTILVTSGIITERRDEVVDALTKNGLEIVEVREDNGWCAVVVTKK